MTETFKEIQIIMGQGTIAIVILISIIILLEKFKYWRKNGCKIKCLCKPHKYKLVWYYLDTEEAVLECEKCGKRKQVFIDYDSIKKEFNLED